MDGHLGCFHVGAMVNGVAGNVLVYGFGAHKYAICGGFKIGVKLLGWKACTNSALVETNKPCSKVATPINTSTSSDSVAPLPHQPKYYYFFLNFSQNDQYRVVLISISPMTTEVEHLTIWLWTFMYLNFFEVSI